MKNKYKKTTAQTVRYCTLDASGEMRPAASSNPYVRIATFPSPQLTPLPCITRAFVGRTKRHFPKPKPDKFHG